MTKITKEQKHFDNIFISCENNIIKYFESRKNEKKIVKKEKDAEKYKKNIQKLTI